MRKYTKLLSQTQCTECQYDVLLTLKESTGRGITELLRDAIDALMECPKIKSTEDTGFICLLTPVSLTQEQEAFIEQQKNTGKSNSQIIRNAITALQIKEKIDVKRYDQSNRKYYYDRRRSK